MDMAVGIVQRDLGWAPAMVAVVVVVLGDSQSHKLGCGSTLTASSIGPLTLSIHSFCSPRIKAENSG
jgi:uncharacterized membrane protein YczE